MKKFCESLREDSMKVKKNEANWKMELLTKELQELYENAKICDISKQKFEKKKTFEKYRNIVKLETIAIIQETKVVLQ